MYDVVVIGAGAAGISAARSCRERRLSSIVFEAGSKIGGRASTVQAPGGSAFDLGAHWLHSPGLNPLTPIVMAGSAATPPPLAAAFSRRGRLLAPPEVSRLEEEIETGFSNVIKRGNSGSDEAALNATGEAGVAFTIEFINKQGVLPDRASCVDFARYVWEGEDIPVRQGFGTVISSLAAGLDIRRDSPVEQIDLTRSDRVRVSGKWGSVEARHVIVTVSTGVLQSGTLRFTPGLPLKLREAIAGLPMGSCNKLYLPFNRPVFGDLPPSLLVPLDNRDEAMEIVIRGGEEEAAVGMFHGPFGRRLAVEGEFAMRAHLLETLAKIFGHGISNSVSPAVMSVNWDANPFVGGYVSAALPGCADARLRLAEPIDTRVAFAGEATSPHFMGDVHGAWLEGRAALDRLLA
jgi:monoamine oxidase